MQALWGFCISTHVRACPFWIDHFGFESYLVGPTMANNKRQRWQGALHTGGVTLKSLYQIARRLAIDGVGRRTLLDSNQDHINRCYHSVDLALTTGGEFKWELAEPNLLIQYMVNHNPFLMEAFSEAARTHPCSQEQPWRMVIGLDEYTPGSRDVYFCFSFCR